MESMRICFLVDSFYPPTTGGELFNYKLIKELSEKGNYITVITRKTRPCNLDIELFHLRNRFSKNEFFEIKKIIKSSDVLHEDHIVTSNFPFYLLDKIMSMIPIPIVTTVHSIRFLEYRTSSFTKSKIFEKIEKKSLEKSQIIITCNMYTKKVLADYLGLEKSKIKIIPPEIDIEKFHPPDFKNYDPANMRILTVAYIHPIKGIEYLLFSIKILKSKIPGIKLYLVGSLDKNKKYAKQMKRLANKLDISRNVEFLGNVDRNSICKLYRQVDIFVLPSLHEQHGLAIMEAMASGLPVVASNVGGIPTLINDGINGFLVPPRDPYAIADRIYYLTVNPAIIKDFGDQGRKIIIHQISSDLSSEFINIYTQAVTDH